MTTIAVRDGIIAADSRTTVQTEEGGSRVFRCEKLYRCFEGTPKEAILGTAGESSSSLVFVDWYRSETRPVEVIDRLINGEADFTVIALTREGLFEFDKWGRGEKILDKFYAIGSGAKGAMCAMHMGASAEQAVRIACKVDPYSAPPITVWTLSKSSQASPRSRDSIQLGRRKGRNAPTVQPQAPSDATSPPQTPAPQPAP